MLDSEELCLLHKSADILRLSIKVTILTVFLLLLSI